MSSGVESGGAIAAVVLAPVGLALGAGWVAWQAGALVVRANRAIDEQIREEKRLQAAAAQQRRAAAEAGHRELVALCESVMGGLDTGGDLRQLSQVEQLRQELKAICTETLPEDTARLESMNSRGLLQVQEIVRRQQRLRELKVHTDTVYEGLSVADLMDDLRVAFSTAQIRRTQGANVTAADPEAFERAQLLEQLDAVTARAIAAVDLTVELGRDYAIARSHSSWLESLLGGLDDKVAMLYAPSTSNERLKRGIRDLEQIMKQFEVLRPSLLKERAELDKLYPVYVQAAQGFGEKARELKSFASARELKGELERLRGRLERAQTCAQIYEQLGRSAYICMAWDQELAAMGYQVKTRSDTRALTEHKPKRAKSGDRVLPFYDWREQELTQFYTISDSCQLQLVVHADGSTSMQTIATGSDADTVREQKQHCANLKLLHERLKENWFLSYDMEETAPPEELVSATAWRDRNQETWPAEVREDPTERERERREDRRREEQQRRMEMR